MRISTLPCILLGTLACCGPTVAAELAVYPGDVSLHTNRDRQSVVVQVTEENGITRDVTKDAKLQFANPELARLEGSIVHPVADGQTELTVEYQGKKQTIPVTVAKGGEDRPISFKLDVMPVFAKAGCNMGSCHGAARGKDGFRLSLFGFDPEGDYYRLTREMSGRRINLARPEASLLIEKSLGKVPHSGGKRIEEGGELEARLLRWVRASAPADQGEVPAFVDLEIYPPSAVLNGPGATQQITVRAKYSDGTDRDVTNLAHFMTNNDTSAAITPDGLVTAGERGEAFIMARFDTMTVGSHFITLPKDLAFEFPSVPEHNYIDKLVHEKLRKLRIAPSDICTDEEFLRRATLDITGKLPTIEEYHAFVSSNDPKKREKLVDDLLSRKEFVELWVMKWSELLQIRTTNQVSRKNMLLYYNWLNESLSNDVPMDEMVRELLSASGGTFDNPATNYYELERDTLKTAENVAQVFMGMRIQCAQCHNHPFDRWTMDDYYGFAAFFSQIGRKNSEDPRERIIFNRNGGDVRHPVGNRVVEPKFLGGAVPEIKGEDRREVLAGWLASPENPYFAKNLANIVWEHFLGRGIIDEVDDVRVSNPPVNAELLDELGSRFTDYSYDFKRLVRDICTSRTYQLSTKTNESNASDNTNFSHAMIRRIRAEVLFDAISQVTETQAKFPGLPQGARAVQVPDGNTSNYFLTTFGRAKRETVCSCEVVMEPNLSQALHLINGDSCNQRIQQGGVVARLLNDQKKEPKQIIEELYIRCLSRKPTADEMKNLTAMVDESENKQQALEDIFWSLGNSQEFLFNH